MRVDVQIVCKDRSSELGLLLQSLRTQTFQDFDIQLVDGSKFPDGRPRPITSHYYIQMLINRLKLEGHDVKYAYEGMPGVCAARNQCFERGKNPLVLRVDDDSVCEPDFVERLVKTITVDEYNDDNADRIGAVGCVVPPLANPDVERNSELFKKLSEIKISKDGEIEEIGDDLWATYKPNKIFEVDHLRSSFLMWRKVGEEIKVKWGSVYDTAYGLTGFREETDISLKMRMLGYKLLVDTAAINYHLHTPSGGVRAQDYGERVQAGEERLRRQVKKWHKEGELKI